MIPSFKAEFRRLFTVRSTYVLLAFAILLVGGLTFYFEGLKSAVPSLTKDSLERIALDYVGLGAVFMNIIAILYIGHEYRYNTILYTLTANAHRTSVLLIKVLSIAAFGLVTGLFFAALAMGCYLAGLSLRDVSLPPQDIDFVSQLSRIAFFFVAYGVIGVLVTFIVRNIIAAIAFMLLFPTTIEGILGIFLKEKVSYLPFTALDAVLGNGALSAGKSTIVACVYLAVFALVAWVFFMRRDAPAQ